MDAPLLTLSLFCMERVGPGVEIAPAENETTREAWEAAGADPSLRVLRDRNTGSMHRLRPPLGLATAAQIIGLDGTPTYEMWNTVYSPDDDFEHRRILSDEQMQTYLTEALGLQVVQLGNGMHHYAGGQISHNDADRFERINRIENDRVPLISTKQALEQYNTDRLIDQYVPRCEQTGVPRQETGLGATYAVRNYARVRSSNAFEHESTGAVFGSPFPGDDLVERWAGFTRETANATGSGEDKDFSTAFGNAVYHHFAHKQVLQAVLRFGRDNAGTDEMTTVYVVTKALPDWVPTVEINSADKTTAVVRALRNVAQLHSHPARQYEIASTLADKITQSQAAGYPDTVTQSHVSDVLDDLAASELAVCRENHGKGGADQYRWVGHDAVEHLGQNTLFVTADETAYYIPDTD
jgi:hypothetical protein